MEYNPGLKKGNAAICDKMDENGGHYAKWYVKQKNINTSWYHLYLEYKKKVKLIETEQNGDC